MAVQARVRDAVLEALEQAFETIEDVEMPDLVDDLVLLESGLDSLGFAVVVTQLEEELGYDPFTESDEPYYPTTLGEFIEFYERFAPDT